MEEENLSAINQEGTILRKAQLRMVAILMEVDKICSKHNIEYWIDYGTLLGAVRHGGFIPWDDDLDISVELKNYSKLCEALKKDLPENLSLQDKSTEKFYPLPFAKVRDKNSFVEDDYAHTKLKDKGLYIDIFPVERGSIQLKKMIHPFFIGLVQKMKDRNALENKRTNPIPYIFEPLVGLMFRLARLFTFTVPKDQLIGAYGTMGLYWTKFSKSSIFPLSKISFEGHEFAAPHDPDRYLKIMYGDYMQIPPPEKRRIHTTNFEVWD